MVILSEFAGAAAELDGVILVNPYSPDDMDRALETAVAMPAEERAERMRRLRSRVLTHDIHQWSTALLQDVKRMSTARRQGVEAGQGR